jgi:chemotaxis protein MotB
VEVLASRYGISHAQLVAAAYGEYRPVASNATVEGRAQNRRIEIIISRK